MTQINMHLYYKDLKQQLIDSDWTVLPDVALTEENKAEWVTWRGILRSQLVNQSNSNIGIPPKPEEIWET